MEPVISLNDILVQLGEGFRLSVDNLKLLPQQMYALTGPNGAGKTTLLRVMALLIFPHKGSVTFAAGCGSLTQKRQNVTLVEQSPYLFDGTVSDNLSYGLNLRGVTRKEQKKSIEEALKLVGLKGFEWRNTRGLSVGEIQRVALARALVLGTQLLLLDEPTSNIDRKSLPSFETLLAGLPDTGTTVVFTTHDLLQPARLNAKVLLIENGRLLNRSNKSIEPHATIRTEKGLWLNPLNQHEQ
jgi:tungstate transport system ATP-binding protein